MREVINALISEGIDFKENENVASRSSFKIGGTVRLAIYPDSKEKLVSTLASLALNNKKFEVVGNASNILFAFDFYDGAMIFTGKISKVYVDGEHISAECGVSFTHLAVIAADNCLSGLEFAYGIPALVGGAVYMNAGAYGSCVGDVLQSSLAYDTQSREMLILDAASHCYGYRESVYMKHPELICLGATFSLKLSDKEQIRAKMQANMTSRREKQPLEYPSAGSYFKRPEGSFAGKLIEDCGLKELCVGGAQVSGKHAGFIINKGGATAEDVLLLEEKIKERVLHRFGVELQREVRLIK